jgi:hypothetical protein
VRTSGGASAKEIDWPAFKAWNNAKFPDFAGRYFLGAPYLWAHGEGGAALIAGVTLGRVAPIQCANKSRQEATGDRGDRFGTEDGWAIADYIGACIDMGELVPVSDFVYLYLEVADGTALSPDYWTAWCTALFNKTVVIDGPAVGGVALPKLLFPFLPCIQCAFPKDAGSAKYKPDAGVTTALDNVGTSIIGRRGRCYGFWARAFDNAAYHAAQPALDWTAFDPYAQKIGTKTEPVPVQIWRHMDQPDLANPVPAAARRLSLDATHVDSGKDPAFDTMLVIKPWDEPLPTEFGVDKGGDLTGEIRCLSRTNMTLKHLPDTQVPGMPMVPPLVGKTSFAFRYYSTPQGQARNAKDLTKSEAQAITRAGAKVVTVWQADVPYPQIPAYLSNAGHGKSDAKNAFVEASTKIEQPANTPIYFAIDCNVNSTGVDTPQENGRAIPTPAQIKAYFEKVRDGYAEYLTDQGDDAVPYYTGVYGCSTLLDMLYVEGLATHFWQAVPPQWGEGAAAARPNVEQWKHSNAWQVCGGDIDAFIHSGVAPCRQMSEWTLRVGWQATGGTFKIQIGAQETAPIQLTALAADVALAVKQIRPAGTVVTGKDPDTPLADGSHQWILFIGGAVDDVKVLNDHLTFAHDPPNRTAEQTFVDFVILNVAWGDTGGWTLR